MWLHQKLWHPYGHVQHFHRLSTLQRFFVVRWYLWHQICMYTLYFIIVGFNTRSKLLLHHVPKLPWLPRKMLPLRRVTNRPFTRMTVDQFRSTCELEASRIVLSQLSCVSYVVLLRAWVRCLGNADAADVAHGNRSLRVALYTQVRVPGICMMRFSFCARPRPPVFSLLYSGILSGTSHTEFRSCARVEFADACL